MFFTGRIKRFDDVKALLCFLLGYGSWLVTVGVVLTFERDIETALIMVVCSMVPFCMLCIWPAFLYGRPLGVVDIQWREPANRACIACGDSEMENHLEFYPCGHCVHTVCYNDLVYNNMDNAICPYCGEHITEKILMCLV